MDTNIEKRRLVYLKWQDSGLSRRAFCKRENVAYATFNYWYKRFTTDNEGGFSEIPMPIQQFSQGWGELIFSSGTRMVFYSAPPTPWLKELLG